MYSVTLAIKAMKNETALRLHLIAFKMNIIKKINDSKSIRMQQNKKDVAKGRKREALTPLNGV